MLTIISMMFFGGKWVVLLCIAINSDHVACFSTQTSSVQIFELSIMQNHTLTTGGFIIRRLRGADKEQEAMELFPLPLQLFCPPLHRSVDEDEHMSSRITYKWIKKEGRRQRKGSDTTTSGGGQSFNVTVGRGNFHLNSSHIHVHVGEKWNRHG